MLGLGAPIVALAVFAATAILACAAASAPLLLTSAASASVQQQVAAGCPDATWPSVTITSYPNADLPERDARIPVAMAAAGLAAPSLQIIANGTIPPSPASFSLGCSWSRWDQATISNPQRSDSLCCRSARASPLGFCCWAWPPVFERETALSDPLVPAERG